MLDLEANRLAGHSTFEGLGVLKDYGLEKVQWLEQCPSMRDASSRLLEGTFQLERLGRHLQVRRGSYSRDWQEVLVAASDGTFARDIRLHQSTGLSGLAADGEHRSSVVVVTAHGPSERLFTWNVENSAAEVCEVPARCSRRLRGSRSDARRARHAFRWCDLPRSLRPLVEATQIERARLLSLTGLRKSPIHRSLPLMKA